VHLPPHLLPAIEEHLDDHTGPGANALLFPAANGGTLAPATLYRHYYKAREAAGRPDLAFHQLRHTGAVFAAQAGGTLAELMARLGHTTPGAAMRYQHAARGRDAEIAARLSEIAGTARSSECVVDFVRADREGEVWNARRRALWGSPCGASRRRALWPWVGGPRTSE